MSQSSTILPNRKQYILQLSETSGNYVVQAELQNPSGYNRNPTSINDLQFNLSTMLGNDDGKFVWGRAGFEKTGEDFRLENNSKGVLCILKGRLVDLRGAYHDREFDLDEKLQMIEYVDQATKETYHKLAEKHPTLPGRTLVLCFDGTSNQFSSKNTNVVKLVELLKKDDPSHQMVYYQTGVGTYSAPGLTTTAGLKVASLLDEGIAWYLYQHVIDGYKYLMETYREGDRIALFGFSRGAFTARALAGMLHCVGLLPRHNVEHVPFAYEVYANAKDDGQSQTSETSSQAVQPKPKASLAEKLKPKDVNPEDFKKTFCVSVRIHFVGVWDTVASVGAFIPKRLPFIEYNPSIMIFRQALALDERRGSFIPSVWDHSRTLLGAQDVREVWFRGEHSDIGGGSAGPDESKEHPQSMLSNITLRWMIRQIVNCDTCILFNYTAVKSYRDQGVLEIPPSNSPGSSADYWVRRVDASIELDKRDVRNKIYDSIGWSPLWLGLEYVGLTSKPARKKNFEPTTTRAPNRKHGRSIYSYRTEKDAPIFIHGSVIDYMMAHELNSTDSNWTKENYTPRAKWDGYGEKDWPGIEDVSTSVAAAPGADATAGAVNPKAGIPESVQDRFKMVRPDTSASWWRIW